jgi:hypothetical protein
MRLIRTSVFTWAAVTLLASTALAQPDVAPRTAVSFAGGAGSEGWNTEIREKRP